MVKQELVLSQQQIEARVAELGRRISDDYRGKKLVMIGVLNGAFIFLADLVRRVPVPHEIDFIRVASYGSSNVSSGKITLSKDAEIELAGKDILLVEDIVDTGTTLQWLVHYFSDKQAASVRTCALIDKNERRQAGVTIDYTGFSLKKGFLVGYGLDYAEEYRHLPGIYNLIFS
jgi:hypoxanthine phosphoribosyltransferase